MPLSSIAVTAANGTGLYVNTACGDAVPSKETHSPKTAVDNVPPPIRKPTAAAVELSLSSNLSSASTLISATSPTSPSSSTTPATAAAAIAAIASSLHMSGHSTAPAPSVVQLNRHPLPSASTSASADGVNVQSSGNEAIIPTVTVPIHPAATTPETPVKPVSVVPVHSSVSVVPTAVTPSAPTAVSSVASPATASEKKPSFMQRLFSRKGNKDTSDASTASISSAPIKPVIPTSVPVPSIQTSATPVISSSSSALQQSSATTTTAATTSSGSNNNATLTPFGQAISTVAIPPLSSKMAPKQHKYSQVRQQSPPDSDDESLWQHSQSSSGELSRRSSIHQLHAHSVQLPSQQQQQQQQQTLQLPPAQQSASSGLRDKLGMSRKTSVSSRSTATNEESLFSRKYGFCDRGSIGKGATAIVRLAHKMDSTGPRKTEKLFAIKEFRPRRKDETEREYVKKLTAEFCISSTLHHPNVVETVDLIQDEHGHWCEVMEYCMGGDLYSVIRDGHMTPLEAECCFKQLIRAVNYLHSMGVAHRDIKPENCLLDDRSRLKLTDFGVSDVFRMAWETEAHTSRGMCGSEPYIAPEVFTNKPYDARCVDVWACGIVLYALYMRGVPFRCATKSDPVYVKYLDCFNSRDASYEGFRRLPVGAKSLLMKMLNPDPIERITITEIIKDSWFTSIMVCENSKTVTGDKHSHYTDEAEDLIKYHRKHGQTSHVISTTNNYQHHQVNPILPPSLGSNIIPPQSSLSAVAARNPQQQQQQQPSQQQQGLHHKPHLIQSPQTPQSAAVSPVMQVVGGKQWGLGISTVSSKSMVVPPRPAVAPTAATATAANGPLNASAGSDAANGHS